jgi:hypothetical protein
MSSVNTNPAFGIIPDNFPYTVESFRTHVSAVHHETKYTRPVSFAMVAEVWALHMNAWMDPRLPEPDFYRIIAEVATVYST